MNGTRFNAIPTPVYFPKQKQNLAGYTSILERIPKDEIDPLVLTDLVKKFPEVQNKPNDIQYATRAILRYNMEEELDGIVILTVHFIGFFHCDSHGKYVDNAWAHLFEIASIRVKKYKLLIVCRLENYRPEINTKTPIVNCQIISYDAVKFGQVLYRNYMLAACAFPPEKTCDFRTELIDEFPKFKPGLSPTQAFQFTYYAFCTRLNRTYYQEIVRSYHERIRTFDGVFDFGEYPIELTEGPKACYEEFMPVIYALAFFPYVHGIVCHKRGFPYIARAVAQVLGRRRVTNLRFVHLVDCCISPGINEIGIELKKKPEANITYWNFANNPLITKAEEFLSALHTTEADVFYLSFSNCHIGSISTLYSAIKNNRHLHNIKYLFMNGNGSNDNGSDVCQPFINHLKYLSENNLHPLQSLGIGGCPSTQIAILECLMKYPQPIEELSFAGTNVNYESTKAILQYIQSTKTLRVLDLSYCRQMGAENIHLVLKEMCRNASLGLLHIRLNGLTFNHTDILSLTKGFLWSDLSRWGAIELANNNMGEFELQFFISLFHRMENLEELDLSGNFHSQMRGIENAIASLCCLKSLKRIRIAGDGVHYKLQRTIYKFLDNLQTFTNLEEIDISGNEIGDEGMQKVIELLKKNNMRAIYVDNSKPVRFRTFQELVDVAKEREDLTFFRFPFTDINFYLKFKGTIGEKMRFTATSLRMDSNQCINDKRHAKGLPSMLSFQCVNELGEIVDEINNPEGSMKRLLENVKTNLHSGVAQDVKITLPYLDFGQDISDGGDQIVVEVPNQEKYHAPHINIRIDEATRVILPLQGSDIEEQIQNDANQIIQQENEDQDEIILNSEPEPEQHSESESKSEPEPEPESEPESKYDKKHHHKDKKEDKNDKKGKKDKKEDKKDKNKHRSKTPENKPKDKNKESKHKTPAPKKPKHVDYSYDSFSSLSDEDDWQQHNPDPPKKNSKQAKAPKLQMAAAA